MWSIGGDNMRKNVEEFFLSLKDANFLAMKLLFELFKKFEKALYIVDNHTYVHTKIIKFHLALVFKDNLYKEPQNRII